MRNILSRFLLSLALCGSAYAEADPLSSCEKLASANIKVLEGILTDDLEYVDLVLSEVGSSSDSNCQILLGKQYYLASLVGYKRGDIESSLQNIDVSISYFAKNLNRHLIPVELTKSLITKTDLLFHSKSPEWEQSYKLTLSIIQEYLASPEASVYHYMLNQQLLDLINKYGQ